MSKWWISACGLVVASVGFSACGINLSGLEQGAGGAGNANATYDANTSTETTQTTSGGNVEASPTPEPSATPSPTPTCPVPTNANDYFGSPRCCYTNAKLCEDFEAEATGASPNALLWTVQKATGDTMEISNAHAARGNHSLHINSLDSGSQHTMIVNTTAFPFANNMFWGRAFVYFNSAYPSNHTTYVAAGPNPNPNYEWLRYSTFGNGGLGGNDSQPDNSSNSSSQLAHDGWSCLEWQYDPPNLKAYYYLNGTLISTLDINSEHVGTNDLDFQQIEIGWEQYTADSAGGSAWDMYFDEIALDDKRIGCAN